MRYTILAFAAGAAAAPFSARSASVCPNGLYSNPQCCATDVLGAIGLDCAVPATTPTTTDDFISGCVAGGQQAKCCVIPVADQDVLCQDVSPGAGDGSGDDDGDDGGAPVVTPTAPGGGAPTAPGGGSSSTSCESSAAPEPTKPAPPAETSDCGCDK